MDSKQRFSNRVENYLRYRPSYPPAVVDALVEITGLTPDWTVADLGSGTGISSRPFLEHGNRVTGIEPNAEMRQAGDELLGDFACFRSVNGSAEETGLADASVDLVLAGQAFHWFDQNATRRECLRILRGEKWAALLWNVRLADTDAFARGYEELLERFGTDYTEYRSRRIDPDELAAFFGTMPLERRMSNEQVFDFDGLRGRHLSASYAPRSGHPNHMPMMEELRRLFEEHASDGRVRFDYDTQVFVSRIG
ncbi:MAG: class I SAM-dependent methyltransferase [Gemmatimonadota bacterium]|nr:class I SAM-dependent methyltransferase [Gemmatimonadota bacterium]